MSKTHSPSHGSSHMLRYARMRSSQVQFCVSHPGRKYRHEKPDLKVLLQKKDETYVDVAEEAWPQFLSWCLAAQYGSSIYVPLYYVELLIV